MGHPKSLALHLPLALTCLTCQLGQPAAPLDGWGWGAGGRAVVEPQDWQPGLWPANAATPLNTANPRLAVAWLGLGARRASMTPRGQPWVHGGHGGWGIGALPPWASPGLAHSIGCSGPHYSSCLHWTLRTLDLTRRMGHLKKHPLALSQRETELVTA